MEHNNASFPPFSPPPPPSWFYGRRRLRREAGREQRPPPPPPRGRLLTHSCAFARGFRLPGGFFAEQTRKVEEGQKEVGETFTVIPGLGLLAWLAGQWARARPGQTETPSVHSTPHTLSQSVIPLNGQTSQRPAAVRRGGASSRMTRVTSLLLHLFVSYCQCAAGPCSPLLPPLLLPLYRVPRRR